jgi:hypothetical protein
MKKKEENMRALSRIALSIIAATAFSSSAITSGQIVVGAQAPEMEKYAARELQRYLYEISGALLPVVSDASTIDRATFIVGQKSTNARINDFVNSWDFTVGPADPGPQGYVLKKLAANNQEVIAIAGSDSLGTLYGVYGLLDDYYGIGFSLGGDVLPDVRSELQMVNVNEKKAPRQYIRGFLPWTNFPQSATVYSIEDYKFIIDQMTKMRMNFILLHNYSGKADHNEMFANFTYNNVTSRVWMATVRSGHGWGCPGWDVNKYLFKCTDLFDDYDFGADCALHNSSLSNVETFRKGASEFQRILLYAHSRGVKFGLGLDIDVIPGVYGTTASNPAVVDARTSQIINDYPDLDYLFCFRSEDMSDAYTATWQSIFNRMYSNMRAGAPQTRIAVSGWGLAAPFVANLPADVICAPISQYTDGCESGSIYGSREYWGCPWLERDMGSSVYYYPYNMNLSNTVAAYRGRAPNMKGFYCLTWRITDAIDPKMSYIAKAPWDLAEKYTGSQPAYNEYAVKNYGQAAASQITPIINQNEAYATGLSECEGSFPFVQYTARSTDIAKATSQLATIDNCIAAATGAGQKARLRLLRCRIQAVKSWCELDQTFYNVTWNDLPGPFETWARNFRDRVIDISSLGNIMSTQNRWVRQWANKENALRSSQTVKAPSYVEARGTVNGAVITWRNTESAIQGFNVYRGTTRINGNLVPANTLQFTDAISGSCSYSVTAVNTSNQESPRSVPSLCNAGNADTDPPNVVVISAPTSCALGQYADLTARVLDDRTYGSISADLYYRPLGNGNYTKIAMERRAKAIFAARIPASAITAAGVEYYLSASDGSNTGYFPTTAPLIPMSLVATSIPDVTPPGAPGASTLGAALQWTASSGDVHWYKIYRGTSADFVPDRSTYVTYVDKGTTAFEDAEQNFEGNELGVNNYYRITAVDKWGNESAPSPAITTTALIGYWPFDESSGSTAADATGYHKDGSVIGGAVWTTGKYGNALSFNGTNGAVVINDATNPAKFTVCAWVKPASARKAANVIVRSNASGPTAYYSQQLRINASGKFEAYVFDGGTSKTVTGTTTIQADAWYHIALTVSNNGQMRLYVDGAQEGSATSITVMQGGMTN